MFAKCYNGGQKRSSNFNNIWNMTTNVVLLSPIYQAPSHELDLSFLVPILSELVYFLVPILSELVYLITLIILELTNTANSRINNMFKYANLSKNHATEVKLGSSDRAWYAKSNDTTCGAIAQRFMLRGEFFINRDNI